MRTEPPTTCPVSSAAIASEMPCPTPSGNWQTDNLAGRRTAFRLAEHLDATGDLPLACLVFSRIQGCPRADICGVRAGFSCAVAAMMARFKQ